MFSTSVQRYRFHCSAWWAVRLTYQYGLSSCVAALETDQTGFRAETHHWSVHDCCRRSPSSKLDSSRHQAFFVLSSVALLNFRPETWVWCFLLCKFGTSLWNVLGLILFDNPWSWNSSCLRKCFCFVSQHFLKHIPEPWSINDFDLDLSMLFEALERCHSSSISSALVSLWWCCSGQGFDK